MAQWMNERDLTSSHIGIAAKILADHHSPVIFNCLLADQDVVLIGFPSRRRRLF